MFIHLPDPNTPYQSNDIKYKKLGYLSLDSNERTNFQARELKSVYIDAPCLFLKLLMHKNHQNKYNLFNQVRALLSSHLWSSLMAAKRQARLTLLQVSPLLHLFLILLFLDPSIAGTQSEHLIAKPQLIKAPPPPQRRRPCGFARALPVAPPRRKMRCVAEWLADRWIKGRRERERDPASHL